MAPLKFGIPAFNYQVVDAAGPTDLLCSTEKTGLSTISIYTPLVTPELVARAPEITFHHVGVTMDPVRLGTSNMTILPTCTVDDCPDLDILLIPGPFLGNFELHPKHAELIRRHAASGKLLWTTCTGSSLVASTGVLDGRRATVNNIEYDWVSRRWPKVNWTREKKWVVDGNIWTSSGAVAGTDMVAQWLIENHGLDVLMVGASTLDYEPRDVDGLYTVFPQRYDEGGNKVATHIFKYHSEE